MYIIVSIIVLLAIVVLVIVPRRKRTGRITPLASIAFAFVLASVLFSSSRAIGYGLMAVGILLALIDMFNGSRKA